MLTDSLDMCPQERGYIYLNGCPDNDQDSIRNSEDDCPNDFGPRELNGCPDTDGDGLLDKNDDCPKIVGPKENNGCPWGDTDEDGLTDNIDNCPEEAGPRENKGCPWGDADGDGLTDNIDKCINQAGPKENDGCPYTDTDNDGVLDKDDECPLTFGVAENKGCPIIEKEEQEVLNTAFDNLEFETGKAIIRSSSFESLDQLAALLIKKPNYKLSIEGHTDNVGNENSNLLLSKSRANAVKIYLESHGVTGAQMTTNWYGAGKPIADNATAEGRQKNRRVEMKVVFD
jgi:outer membrane protein OmpA-like peptidoglycan-associated protein